jgi:hypothetical protein
MTTIAIETGKAAEEAKRSERAERLADRILLGAAKLAAFAESISGEEWTQRVSASDQRTVGAVVNHVANMYIPEIEAAKAVASGVAEVGVTWDDIAQLNAKQASENPDPEKSKTIDLLLKNSRDAADAVRRLTDDQLDTAALFGLSYNAPVTAQFVIEDHALRHSWHHLAKIRKALGR